MSLPEQFSGDVHASAEGASRKFGVPPFRPLLRPWVPDPVFAPVVAWSQIEPDKVLKDW